MTLTIIVLVIIALMLLGQTIAIIWTAKRLSIIGDDITHHLRQASEEISATLQQAHITLENVDRLTHTADKMIREELTPTISHARLLVENAAETSESLNSAIVDVKKVAGRVAYYSDPTVIAVATNRMVKSSASRASLWFRGIREAVRTLLTSNHHNELVRRENDGDQ